MLKIRENFDLKELEKYGFFLTTKSKVEMYVWQNKYYVDCIEIDIKTRKIICLGDKESNTVLYDLIKADIVVKE